MRVARLLLVTRGGRDYPPRPVQLRAPAGVHAGTWRLFATGEAGAFGDHDLEDDEELT